MNLSTQITQILDKLNDPDCVSIAEKEIKTLIINQIDDGEKLNILINCIGDEKDLSNYTNKKTKYNQLKLFISIAEIFQHQVLEFLPKIFAKLNKKIKDGDMELADIISDTYGGVIEFAFKGAEDKEILEVFDEIFGDLYELVSKGFKNVQSIAALSITKIIQNCLSEILVKRFSYLYDNILRLVISPNTKTHFYLLESLLSLILSVQQKVPDISSDLAHSIMKFLDTSNPKTKKITIDIYYTLCAIDKKHFDFHQDLYKKLQILKTDHDKSVREAAMECLKQIQQPEPEKPKKQISQKIFQEKKKSPQKKAKYVSKKMNLEHVKSSINKKNINKNFLKNEDDVQILVKEPEQKIDYEHFYDKNQEILMNFQENLEKEKSKKFGTLPNFNKTETNQEPLFEEPQNYVVMKSKNYFQKEPNFESFKQNSPFKETTPFKNPSMQQSIEVLKVEQKVEQDDIHNLKKYIKMINRKLKKVIEKVDSLESENQTLKSQLANFTEQLNLMKIQQEQKTPAFQYILNPNAMMMPSPYQEKDNKWMKKSKQQDINDQVHEMLSTTKRETHLIPFLRSFENMKKCQSLNDNLKSKLLKEIFYLITKNVHEEDLLILDYCLKWIKFFLDNEFPDDVDLMKQLYSILFLIFNSVNEESISEASDYLLNHPFLQQVYGKSNVERLDDSKIEYENSEEESDRELDPY